MDTSFRDVATQALGMAELIGFFVPGEGYLLSIGAAGLRSAIDLFWPGGNEGVDPMAALGSAVAEAMVYLQRQNERFTWSMFEAEHLAVLRLKSDDLAFARNAVLLGAAREGDPDPEVHRNWQRVLDGMEDECLLDSAVMRTIDWIVQPANRDFRHLLTPVYVLAVALRLNYLQLGLLIQSEHMVRNYEVAYSDWKARRAEGGGSSAPEEEPPSKPRGDSEAVRRSPYFQRLVVEAERFALESSQRVEEMANEFEEVHVAKAERARQFVIKAGPTDAGYYVEDRARPEVQPGPFLPQTAAELLLETRRATAVQEVEERLLSRKGGLREMSEDGLADLRKSVGTIEKLHASFPRTTAPREAE